MADPYRANRRFERAFPNAGDEVASLRAEITRLEAELAAARERVRELEKYSRNLLAVSRAVGVLGATEVSEAEEALDRLLAAPTSAAHTGEG